MESCCMRAMTSRARKTVPFSASYSVQWSAMGSRMCMSAGCTVALCEYRKSVMNSCRKTFTSAAMSADDIAPGAPSVSGTKDARVRSAWLCAGPRASRGAGAHLGLGRRRP